MEINDLNRILDEGKLSEADEVGDAAAKPTATVDSPAEEANVSSEEKDVAEHLDDEHVEQSEDVASVPVTEEAEAAAKPVATTEKEPEEAKPETEVKAVKDMQDCENAETAEEAEPVEITEDEALDYLLYLKDNLSEEEFASAKDEALNEGLVNFFRRSGSLKDKWAAANKYDRETKHALNKMDKDSKKAANQAIRRDDKAEIADLKAAGKTLNYNNEKVGKAYDKFLTKVSNKATADNIRKDYTAANTKLATQLGNSVKSRDTARRSATEVRNSEKDANIDLAKKAYTAFRDKSAPARAITEGIVEDNLEVEPEIVKAEDKFEDGVATPITPVETPVPEVEDIPSEQPEKELNDVLDDKVEETPAEEKSTYDLVTESLDNILASLKEEAEAAAKPVATTEKEPEEAKPETEVKAVKDMQDCENAESAEEVEPVEIKESSDELSISDMVAIVTEAAKRCKEKGKPAGTKELCEEVAAIVGDSEGNAFNVDKVINSKDVAEMGTEKNEKEIEKADDLHEGVIGSSKADTYNNKYGVKSVAKEDLKDKGELKGYVAPIVWSIFGLPLIGAILAVSRHVGNSRKITAKENELRSQIMHNPEAKAISDKIANIASSETPNINELKDLKIKLKDVLKQSGNLQEAYVDYLFEDITPVATTEKEPEEACPVGTAKEVEKDLDADEVTDAEEVEAVTVKESVKYNSIKEACMLDEDYFSTDSYSIDTADKKFSRLTEQVALLMARESNDPMYNELLKEAVYTKRLQEAICEKYHSEAEKKACKIAKKKMN